MLRVAVKLPVSPGRIGDFVADVTALEVAGADSIWLDASHATGAEPWIFLGAASAVTHRARLGVIVGTASDWREAVETLARLSGGRVVLGARAGAKDSGSSPLSASLLIICTTRGEAERWAHVADGVIFRGGEKDVRAIRAKRSQDGEFELWIEAPIPADKASWANLVATLESAGATGIMVTWDPRIIDLLRNAGEPDDRTDLLIATG